MAKVADWIVKAVPVNVATAYERGAWKREDVLVSVAIDLQQIAKQMAQKAHDNKSRRAKIAKGAVVVSLVLKDVNAALAKGGA